MMGNTDVFMFQQLVQRTAPRMLKAFQMIELAQSTYAHLYHTAIYWWR